MVDLLQHAAKNGSVLCLQVLGVGGSTSEVLRRLDLLGDDFQPLAGEVRQSALCIIGMPPTRCCVRQQLLAVVSCPLLREDNSGKLDCCLSPIRRWALFSEDTAGLV